MTSPRAPVSEISKTQGGHSESFLPLLPASGIKMSEWRTFQATGI